MKRLLVETKVLAGFTVALAILASVGVFSYQSALSFIRTSDSVARSREITETLEEIFSVVSQAESGQRGYLVTGDEEFLRPRLAAPARIERLSLRLTQLASDSTGLLERLPELRRRIGDRLVLLDRVLEAYRVRGPEGARPALQAGSGTVEMRALEEFIDALEDDERARLAQHTREAQSSADRTLVLFSLTLLASIGFLALLYWGIRREIAERRQVEERLVREDAQLRESEARIRAIVDTAVDGIITIDERGVVDTFNPAAERTFGYAAAEVVGRNVSMLMPSPHREAHDGYIARYLASGEKRVIGIGREVVGGRKDGSTFPMDLAVGEARIGARRLFTAVVRDITLRKQAEARQVELLYDLGAANEELKNFAYVVSHDLKAPLRGIGSLADWLVSDYADKLDGQGREYLALLKNRVTRMDGLIDGVLEYSRVGRVKETRVSVDLNALVPEIVDALAAPPSVTISVQDRMPTVVAERTRLRQLFQNLIGNAIKHLDRPHGEVRVAAHDDGDHYTFSVADNGPGIDPRHHERIFQLFQTLSPRDRKESTGVGLALVKKIVELHGGRVWLESQTGQGTTFFFTLPKAGASTTVGGGHEESRQADSAGRG
jgi:PAS domain S-box-containing protein